MKPRKLKHQIIIQRPSGSWPQLAVWKWPCRAAFAPQLLARRFPDYAALPEPAVSLGCVTTNIPLLRCLCCSLIATAEAGLSKCAQRFGVRRPSAALGSPIPVGFKFISHFDAFDLNWWPDRPDQTAGRRRLSAPPRNFGFELVRHLALIFEGKERNGCLRTDFMRSVEKAAAHRRTPGRFAKFNRKRSSSTRGAV